MWHEVPLCEGDRAVQQPPGLGNPPPQIPLHPKSRANGVFRDSSWRSPPAGTAWLMFFISLLLVKAAAKLLVEASSCWAREQGPARSREGFWVLELGAGAVLGTRRGGLTIDLGHGLSSVEALAELC